MNKKISLFLLLNLFFFVSYADQLESGKVYVFANKGRDPEHAMSISSSGTSAVTTAYSESSQSELKQQWYVTGSDADGYLIRNLQTGAYLTSNPNTSAIWPVTLTDTPDPSTMTFRLADESDGKAIYPKNKNYSSGDYICAHRDGSSNVVTWRTLNSPASIWHPQMVNYTDEEIKKLLDRLDNIAGIIVKTSEYEAHLDRLFTDKACWQLNDGITSENLSTNEDYLALAPELQAMVKKVAADNWTETKNYNSVSTTWEDPYARKYRLQLYEPYSEGASSASMAGIQAYTNMNNPTGIVGDRDDLIYVMVNDEIPEGTTLYIQEVPDTEMYNTPTAGSKLKRGLNIIQCNHDNSHYFVYYTITTAQPPHPGEKNQPVKGRELSNFEPIKIHIEGGRINGFFNHIGDKLYTPDTRKDFEYTVQRATHPMYDFVAQYVILHLHLFDTPSDPKETDPSKNEKCVKNVMFDNIVEGPDREYDPVKIMQAWDRMCFAERILMGIQSDEEILDEYNRGYYETIVNQGYKKEMGGVVYDADPGYHYNDYFNNRMMGISQRGSLYMNATSWRSAYNVSTIEAILTQFCDGSIWGPAHEYGHMNQGPMNMAGTTEESNNIFSNVAIYYVGKQTSRSDYISSQLKVFLADQNFLQNGTWGTTRMFWQLWLYYHAAGHNKKFYPRLYELLRKYPLKKTTVAGGPHNELYDQLQFAKMCCIAAEEDLTNFFTAWGFFVPLDGMFIDDYYQYNAVLSQEDIDAVKKEIASLKFPVNNSIILIDDRPGNTDRTSFDGFPKQNAGTYGGLNDFIVGNEKSPSGNFSFMVNDNSKVVTIKTDGHPGAGYLVWDEKGNLLAFSNSNSFTVNSEVAKLLLDGKATVSAVGSDNKTAEVVNVLQDGSVEDKKEMLKSALSGFDELLKYIDPTDTKVGYFHASAKEVIENIRDEIQGALDDENISGKRLTQEILKVYQNYDDIKKDRDLSIQIENGAAYLIRNVGANRTLYSNATSVGPNTDTSSYAAQWIVEGNPDIGYSFKSFEDFNYISLEGVDNNSIVPLRGKETWLNQLYVDGRPGIFAIGDGDDLKRVLVSEGNNVNVGSSASGNNAYWTITKVHDSHFVDLRTELRDLNEWAQELYQEYVDIELWLQIYYKCDDLMNVYRDVNVSKEELEETVKDMRNFLTSYSGTIYNSIFVTADIGLLNDGVDDLTSSVNRQIFNTENSFEGLISLSTVTDGKSVPLDIDVNNVIVSVKPVDRHSWATLKYSTDDDVDEAYQNAFRQADPNAALMEQYYSVGADYIDGFYIEERVSGRIKSTSEEGTYNLVLNVPCSGIYEVSLSYANDDYVIFTKDNDVPVFTVEIYPNLFRTFGNNQGLNIDGFSFYLQDGVHDPTIVFPLDYFDGVEARQCKLYLPGTYFASQISASIVDSAYPVSPEYSRARRKAAALSADASNYYLPLTLGQPKEDENNLLKVSVAKNGATANYSIYLSTGENPTFSTHVGDVIEEEGEVYYLDLNGFKVEKPGHGLYIRVNNGKATKVIL